MITIEDRVSNEYFEWLHDLACKDRYPDEVSFRKLLMHLYNTDFRYSIARDEDRAHDGRDLRYRFGRHNGYSKYDIQDILDTRPCSVFEMILSLAIRCEEDIMDNAEFGDRKKQWFWIMIVNLGLGSMTDDRYDRRLVDNIVNRFLDREYEPNGRGGLFVVRDAQYDLRSLEIWYQMCAYLNGIT